MRGNRHEANHKQGIRRVAEIQSGESEGPHLAAGYRPVHLRGNGYDAEKIGQHFLEILPKITEQGDGLKL